MDMWGSTLIIIFKDVPDLVAGEATWYTYTKVGVVVGCQMVNLCLQGFFLNVIWKKVVTPAKVQIQEDYAQYHKEMFQADGSFDSALWNTWNGPIVSLCGCALANSRFTAFVMFLWILRMLGEITDTATLSKNMFQLPGLPPDASVTDMVVEEKEKDVVAALTFSIRAIAYCLVVGPKFLIGFALTYVGMEWFAATENLTDLILNALALEFIIGIDELVLTALVPKSVKEDLDRAAFAVQVDPAKFFDAKQSEWKGTLRYFLVTLFVVYLYVNYFQLVLPGFDHDIHEHCTGPVLDRVYDLTCKGVGSLFGGPTCFPLGP